MFRKIGEYYKYYGVDYVEMESFPNADIRLEEWKELPPWSSVAMFTRGCTGRFDISYMGSAIGWPFRMSTVESVGIEGCKSDVPSGLSLDRSDLVYHLPRGAGWPSSVTRILGVGTTLNLVSYSCMAGLGIVLLRHLRGLRRRRLGLCRRCGYDLALMTPKCPECGADLTRPRE